MCSSHADCLLFFALVHRTQSKTYPSLVPHLSHPPQKAQHTLSAVRTQKTLLKASRFLPIFPITSQTQENRRFLCGFLHFIHLINSTDISTGKTALPSSNSSNYPCRRLFCRRNFLSGYTRFLRIADCEADSDIHNYPVPAGLPSRHAPAP